MRKSDVIPFDCPLKVLNESLLPQNGDPTQEASPAPIGKNRGAFIRGVQAPFGLYSSERTL